MYDFLNKYGQALAFGIGVLVVLIFLVSIFSEDPDTLSSLTSDGVKGPEKYATSAFDFGLYASIGLAVIAFIAAIVFGLVQVASNPKGSLKGAHRRGYPGSHLFRLLLRSQQRCISGIPGHPELDQ